MVTAHVEAVVVRSDRDGEADRLLTLYTRESGRLLALARGADRPRNRWAGRTRLFARIRGDLYQKRRGAARYTLTQSQLLRAHEGIQLSLRRVEAAARVCEIAAALTPVAVAQPALWDLLTRTLDALDRGSAEDSALPVFQLRFLEIMGLGPYLAGCAACGRAYSGRGPACYSAEKGGLVCRACVKHVASSRLLGRRTMEVVSRLKAEPVPVALQISAPPQVWRQMTMAFEDHLEYYLDFQSRVAGWLGRP